MVAESTIEYFNTSLVLQTSDTVPVKSPLFLRRPLSILDARI